MPSNPLPLALRSRSWAGFRSAPRSDTLLPVPSFTRQQARVLFLRRLPLALEDAAHSLRADAELVGEDGSRECVGVVRVQRAQAVHRRAGKLVRRRPPFGKF